MLDVSIIFKLAGVSLLIIIIDKIIKASGKDDFAVVVNIAGLIVILMMVLSLVNQLFNTIRTMFSF